MGVGGTQWSLGGDVSNIGGNPAGLGFFRSSEASVTLGYTDWGVETSYLNQPKNYHTSSFAVPNLSYVMANPRDDFSRGAFKGGAFGISLQRIANFNTEYGFFSDKAGSNSIIDSYLQDANGYTEDQVTNFGLTGLGYNTYQIGPVIDAEGNAVPKSYESINGFVAPFQDENIKQEGKSNQINFAYGANFNYKLFIGGSIGLRTLNFSSIKTYKEEFNEGPLLNSSLQETLRINGSGVNLNLGLIYKPIDYLNLGFNFQSPTFYALNEEYSAGVVANYDNFKYEPENKILGKEEALTDIILSSYNLNTPLKVGGGATVFLAKNGFISLDVDYVDYSQSRLSSRDFDEGPDNMAIQNTYKGTIDFRAGIEYKINMLRIRGGYAFYGDPIANSPYDRSTQQISGGVGVKFDKIGIDFALVNQKYNTLYSSYQVLDTQGENIGPVTELKNSIINGVLTLNFSF
jgi:long-subunit fatty acid transport protein